jgi:hypothetical protein
MSTSLRTYGFAAMALYWLVSFRDGGGVIHRPWLRLTLGVVFGLCAFVSAAFDHARDVERERMRWDD